MSSAGRTLPLLIGALVVLAIAAGMFMLLRDEERGPAATDGPALVREGSGEKPPVELPEPAAEPEDRAPPPPPEEEPDTGTFVGRVVTRDRRPVPDARVEALMGAMMRIGSVVPNLASTGRAATSGTDGRFELTEVPAGASLTLRLTGDDFQLTDAGPYMARVGEALDVGDIVVAPGLLVRGVVLSPTGDRVAGAQVGLHYVPTSSGWIMRRTDPALRVVTDEEGEFAFANVREGSHSLEVSADGYAHALVKGNVSPLETESERWVTITLARPEPIVGSVLERQGEPLVGVTLFADPISYDVAGAVTTSAEDGTYRFDTLAPGKYRVVAQHPGFKIRSRDVHTGNEEREGLLRMVRNGGISGVVLDPDGYPVPRFELLARQHITPGMMGGPLGNARRFQDPQGRFAFDDLPEGFYSFDIWAPGYSVTRTSPLFIEQGQHLTGQELHVARGSDIRGVVVDDSGAPVAGARVEMKFNRHVEAQGIIDDESEQTSWLRETRTDRDGVFVLANTTAGIYQLLVDHPDHALARFNDVAVSADSDTVLDEPLVVHPGAVVRGTARTFSGNPVGGAVVSIASVDGFSLRVTADGLGRFEFQRVPPGTHLLSATRGETAGDFAQALRLAIQTQHDRERHAVEVSSGATVERDVTVGF